ncbi:hypothetical protein LINGRAHAP2_LOCUS9846, partial [Linum grandiflorum]
TDHCFFPPGCFTKIFTTNQWNPRKKITEKVCNQWNRRFQEETNKQNQYRRSHESICLSASFRVHHSDESHSMPKNDGPQYEQRTIL